ANASDTPIVQDKETQLQHWTNFVVNEVMPKVATYAPIDNTSPYAYERDFTTKHGKFNNSDLPKTEQLAKNIHRYM
ncbi:MAG: hypothetical protein J6V11_05540, partial [Alphaproteobacteria bacterium]|nr:hypothetical protein [Alphaproteobacteria bacterium]